MKFNETLYAVIESMIVVMLSYLAGYYFTGIFHSATAEAGGLWAAISGVFVISDKHNATLKSSRVRVLGSFIGCLISGVYLYFFKFSVLGFGACIGVGVVICKLLRIPDHLKVTGITISVVIIISLEFHDLPAFMNAALRFSESVIGTLIAYLIAQIGGRIEMEKPLPSPQ